MGIESGQSVLNNKKENIPSTIEQKIKEVMLKTYYRVLTNINEPGGEIEYAYIGQLAEGYDSLEKSKKLYPNLKQAHFQELFNAIKNENPDFHGDLEKIDK